MSILIPDNLNAASQLAMLRALQGKAGSSQDPADYQLPWVQFGGSAFDDRSKFYRPELNPPTDFVVGGKTYGAGGALAVVLAVFSGWKEDDRAVDIYGKKTLHPFAIWKNKPKFTVVKGSGGGFKTDRGGWVNRYGELILLVEGELCALTLFDQHHVITNLNQMMEGLPTSAFYEAKLKFTKKTVSEAEYGHYEPHFEVLGVVGEKSGPTAEEIAYAKRLWPMIAQISYATPDIPLRLVVNQNPLGGAPSYLDEAPLPDPDDPGATPHDDGPDCPF